MMRNTSTFLPGALTPAQFSELQSVCDQVCKEFDFGLDDQAARDRIAEALMAIPPGSLKTDGVLRAARQTCRDIVRDRRG